MTLEVDEASSFGTSGHLGVYYDGAYLVSLFTESGLSSSLFLFDIFFAVYDIIIVERDSTAPSTEIFTYFYCTICLH